MNTPTVVADFELESNIWNIEGRSLQVSCVSVLHPTVQFGLEKEYYRTIRGDELYGTIRSYQPISMLVTPTDPIMVCLIYYTDELQCIEADYYTIDFQSYAIFQNFFVGFKTVEDTTNWIEEGF